VVNHAKSEPAPGSEKKLTPDLFYGQNFGNVFLYLLGCPGVQNRWTANSSTNRVHGPTDSRGCQLLVDSQLMQGIGV
jgi:hypothetical protein